MSLYRIDKLFDFEKGTLQSSKCEPGKYIFITASAEWKTHKDFSYDCEALVFAAAASGSLGRTHYVEGKFIASDLCFILSPKDPENFPIDLKFYHIVFNELRSDIVKSTKAGTSKEAISLGNFAKYELPYFEIERQIAIKEHFVNAEETKVSLITELDDQSAKVTLLRQAFLREAMQGKLVKQNPKDEPASELLKKIKAEKEKLIKEKKLKKEKPLLGIEANEVPFEIPSSWAWCRLGEIALKITDGFHNTPPKLKEGIPYISATHVKSEKIAWKNSDFVAETYHRELFKKAYPKKGEILIVNIGAGCGTPAIIDVDYEFSFKNTAILKFNQDLISNMFLFYFFIFSKESIYTDLTQGGLQPFLSLKILNSISVPLPPIPEQHQIVAKLAQLMQLCDDLEKSIQESKTHTGLLLQSALRDALKAKDSIQDCVVA